MDTTKSHLHQECILFTKDLNSLTYSDLENYNFSAQLHGWIKLYNVSQLSPNVCL